MYKCNNSFLLNLCCPTAGQRSPQLSLSFLLHHPLSNAPRSSLQLSWSTTTFHRAAKVLWHSPIYLKPSIFHCAIKIDCFVSLQWFDHLPSVHGWMAIVDILDIITVCGNKLWVIFFEIESRLKDQYTFKSKFVLI